jgi:hypothetical protein
VHWTLLQWVANVTISQDYTPLQGWLHHGTARRAGLRELRPSASG